MLDWWFENTYIIFSGFLMNLKNSSVLVNLQQGSYFLSSCLILVSTWEVGEKKGNKDANSQVVLVLSKLFEQ